MSALIRVVLSRGDLEIEPGQRGELLVTIQNLSEIIDRYRITAEGIDPSRVTISRQQLALFPQDQDQIPITLHPPTGPKARAGHYDLRIQVTSEENPAQRTTVTLHREVVPLPDLNLALRPQRQTGSLPVLPGCGPRGEWKGQADQHRPGRGEDALQL